MKTRWMYTNGNCDVSIAEDGTKIREWPDGETPRVEFPESIDLKITNRCQKGCPFCHESSTPDGEHASIDRIISKIEDLPNGVEIAIGGGDPLEHPRLATLLVEMSELICNITVDQDSIIKHNNKLALWQHNGLIHGIGVSCRNSWPDFPGNFRNIVIHGIVGINKPEHIIHWLNGGYSVLVLGYKTHGRGVDNPPDIREWQFKIGRILQTNRGRVSFDNLALKQLRIKERIAPEFWQNHYMGDDGQFTMYYDAVKNEYAISSISERRDGTGMTIREMFKDLQEDK